MVIFLPDASETEVWHERTASPFRCTVQAPQSPTPQPNLVPVSCMCSRITQSSGVSPATSTLWSAPFTFSVAIVSPFAFL